MVPSPSTGVKYRKSALTLAAVRFIYLFIPIFSIIFAREEILKKGGGRNGGTEEKGFRKQLPSPMNSLTHLRNIGRSIWHATLFNFFSPIRDTLTFVVAEPSIHAMQEPVDPVVSPPLIK